VQPEDGEDLLASGSSVSFWRGGGAKEKITAIKEAMLTLMLGKSLDRIGEFFLDN